MRRAGSIPLQNSNLLLDTLTNALGGIIFIALLVVLLAFQVPVHDSGNAPKRAYSPKQIETALDDLSAFESKQALEQRLENYKSTIQAYEASGLMPITPRHSLDALIAEDLKLSQSNRSHGQSYQIPSLRQSPELTQTYVALFKDNRVYLAGLHPQSAHERQSFVVQDLTFQISGNRVWIQPTGPGQTVSQALDRLLSDTGHTSAGLFDPDQCKLTLFVYPNSIQTFHTFRSRAMKRMPYNIWIGLTENQNASLHLRTSEETKDLQYSF